MRLKNTGMMRTFLGNFIKNVVILEAMIIKLTKRSQKICMKIIRFGVATLGIMLFQEQNLEKIF